MTNNNINNINNSIEALKAVGLSLATTQPDDENTAFAELAEATFTTLTSGAQEQGLTSRDVLAVLMSMTARVIHITSLDGQFVNAGVDYASNLVSLVSKMAALEASGVDLCTGRMTDEESGDTVDAPNTDGAMAEFAQILAAVSAMDSPADPEADDTQPKG